jgi:hypothetical protein
LILVAPDSSLRRIHSRLAICEATCMNRTRFAAHAVALLLSVAVSIAVATTVVYSKRSVGLAGSITVPAAVLIGVGLGFLVARRRARKRSPHRLVIRRGVWLTLIPCVLGMLAGSLIVMPSMGLWVIAMLVGLGIATAIMMTSKIAGNTAFAAAGLGVAIGLITVFALSQANLRGAVEQVGEATGVSREQLDRLPQTISLEDGKALSTDPRTGILSGSIAEARTQVVRAQFGNSLRLAVLFAFVGLLTSLLLPRKFRTKDIT